MKISEIVTLVEGRLVCGDAQHDREVFYGFASDLMSDVLTLLDEQILMITGLTNTQAIRTAQMSDIHVILFTRGKNPTPAMISLAREEDIALITTPFSSFKSSALLFTAGLKPIY